MMPLDCWRGGHVRWFGDAAGEDFELFLDVDVVAGCNVSIQAPDHVLLLEEAVELKATSFLSDRSCQT